MLTDLLRSYVTTNYSGGGGGRGLLIEGDHGGGGEGVIYRG